MRLVREPDAEVVAARVRAARAYANLNRQALASGAAMSASTLDSIEGKRGNLRGASWSELGRIADACGVPFAWFTADFDQLPRIVPSGMPQVATERTPAEVARGRRTGTPTASPAAPGRTRRSGRAG